MNAKDRSEGKGYMLIDVIIPIYKPDESLFQLLDMLGQQSIPIHEVILINTEKKYFQQLISDKDFGIKYKNVRVHHISKKEFDHGGTRRRAVSESKADVFVMMTQDAKPEDETLMAELTGNLKDKVAVAYARQLPDEECGEVEKLARRFNYPAESVIKSAKDMERLGIKTYFCSNVCAAYQRSIYDELGGFVPRTMFNEDMLYAAKAVKAGYSIAYEADARVIHSHNYTNLQQLRRNFDLGVSQAEHPEVFQGVPSETEGKRLVKETTSYLKKKHMKRLLPHFYMQCASKYAGYLLGKNYRHLPRKLVLAITTSKEYWNNDNHKGTAGF